MKKYLLLITICCLGGLVAMSQTTGENTLENTPHNGQDPCERPTPIVTNPFAPQNTEWFSQRNRFNWMDYVSTYNTFKLAIPYYDPYRIYHNHPNDDVHLFVNPFFGNNQAYLGHINLYSNSLLHNEL